MTLLTKSTYLKQEYREANITKRQMLNSIIADALLVEDLRKDQSRIILNQNNKCLHQSQKSETKYKICSVNLRRSGEICDEAVYW